MLPQNSCNDGVEKCKTINVAPIPPTTLPPVVVCNEDLPYYLPWDDPVYITGTYQHVYQSYQGCDSTVRITVNVKPPIIKYLAPQTVCAGSCITICGEEYCDGGSYSHVCESYQGCDSVVSFSLIVLQPLAEITSNGVLSCNNDTITLTSSPSVGTKIWKLNGTVIGGGNSIKITQPGTVILTVTASAGGSFCVETDTLVITGNTTPPTVSATGGVLGCGAAQAQLGTNTNATGPTYLWSPSTGLSATNIANPIATQPGTYTVQVTDGVTGCTNTASIQVTGNTTPPAASATGGVVTCANTTISIGSSTNVANPTYSWSGPAGFTSTQQNPNNVMAAGTYTVTITNTTNNCTATATTTVTTNTTPPSASATGGVISCVTPTITLNGSSPTGGVTYSWTGPSFTAGVQNPSVDTAGVYTLVVTNPANGCTSTATTTVTGNTNLPTAAATGGEVSCGAPNLVLMGSSTTPGATFAWVGPGFTAAVANPSVSAPGTYTLTVTGTNSCTQTATATVTGNFAVPNADATGGTITCSASSTTISGTSTTPGVTFQWIGPSGGIYNGPNPTVSNVGTYILTVTSPNGCTATATATVQPDANVPNATAMGGTLDCNIASVVLNGGSTTPGALLNWVGPGGFQSTLEDPTVSVSGTYTLTVSNPANGCTAIATADVILDDAVPGAVATGGTLTCTDPSLDLTGSATATNVTWSWSGPGGFTSTVQNPTVMAAGDYSLTVTGANGCTSSTTTTVLADQNLPVPASTTGTLTCSKVDLTLNGSANVNVSYAWSGPNSFTSIDQNPTVNMPGDYTLTVTADNGCTSATTVTVMQDIVPPDITAAGNTITCTDPMVPLSGGSATGSATFSWLGPNGFTSSNPNPVVQNKGTYTLIVTGPNGCTSESSVDVLLDTEAPTVFAQVTGVLTCAATSIDIATTASNSTSPIVTYAWTGPNSFSSALEDPSVTDPGTYTLVVTSANGCTKQVTTDVTQDVATPNASAVGDTLTCLITSVALTGSSTTPNATFSWQDPSGGIFSDVSNPDVAVAGIYTLTVTGPNGCTASSTATVILDGDFPDASAVSTNNLNCTLVTTQLQGSSGVPGVSYSWTAANGDIIGITPNISISSPGTYQLAVTAQNGCVTNANVTVTQDITLPGATALGDTIDCITGQTPVTGNSPTPGVSYAWTGPNNFTSSQQSPVVSQNGIYSLTVTGANGCTSTATATVTENTASPVVTVGGAGTLTCDLTQLTLTSTITTPGATGVWTNPGGTVISSQPTVDVSAPGVYTYTVTAQNGCISSPTVTVGQNVTTPQNVTVTGGLIDCTTPMLALSANSTTPNITYAWTGPGGFTSTLQNPQTGTGGTYTVVLTNQANGCKATAVTNVTEDFTQPNINVVTQTITCTTPTVTLDATTNVSFAKFAWTGPDINASNKSKEDPKVTKPGTYVVVVTAQNGCTKSFSIDVIADVMPPDVATTGVTLTCTTPSNTITGTSLTPGVTYSWTGPGGFASTQPSPTVNQTGNYVLTVTAPNGCTATSVAAVIPDSSIPTVDATGATLTCAITSVQINATSNTPNATWQWAGPGGYTSTVQSPSVTVPGNYTVVVTAPNGCTASKTVQIPGDTAGPNIVTGVPNQLNCTTTQVTLNAGVQAPGNYTYQWTTQTGTILSGAFSQNPTVSAAAVYSVLVTNQQNGCTSTKDVTVKVDSATVSGAVLNVRDVSCFGKTDGVIGVANVIGGTPTFLYSLDNLPFVAASFFTSLKPGSHSLVIQDANGCEWQTTIEIGEPEELKVNLGMDTTIHLGQSIQLSLDNTVNFPNRVVKLILDPTNLDSVFCDTCSGILSPINSFRYFVTVVDSNGCKATDSRIVIVDKTRYVYIPNVFNPESSGNNNLFMIFGGEDVVEIKSFRVYDRWGNAVHEYFNFPPNSIDAAWDGTIRGEKANPAVFVYYAEILFKDGETVLYKGDVTLLRD